MSDPYALRAEDIQTPYKNIADMFFQQVGKFGDRVVLREKVDGRWTEISWNKLGDDVNRFAFGLRELGVEPKDVVAIISNNRSQWVIADYGTLTAGAFLVGVYVTLPSHDVKYILENSEAKVMIVENQEQLDKVLAVFDQLPNLKKIVLIEGEKPAGNDNVITFDELLALGDDKDPSELFDIWGSTTHDDIVTLVYTSGTTGPPKGAILTHGSVLWILESGTKVIDMSGVDETLSFLPLCHVFERVGGLWAAFYVGGIINFAESIDKLMDNMGEVRPTVFLSVPRMLEKAYGKIHSNLEKASPVKRAMFNWALSVGRETMPTRLARKPLSGLSKLKFSLAQALVLGKVKERFGGRMRFIISGGAPLAKEIAEFFMAMDIWVLEGWGMTETSAAASLNTFDHVRLGSVGRPAPGVLVKIAEDGEILVKSPNLFRGYWKNDEATAEALVDGWMHTGDIGHIDDAGFLYITDRKKDLIITAGGKNIAPQNIEGMLKNEPGVSNAMVHGDKRKYLTVLITVDEEAVREQFGDITGPPHEDARVRELVEKGIKHVNAELPRYEQLKQYKILDHDFSVDTGELTPTLKLKRKVITQHYADLLDSMYAAED